MEKFLITEIRGDLGEQLFKIASSYSYSKKENIKMRILKNNNTSLYWETLLKKIKPYLIEEINELSKDNILFLNQYNFRNFNNFRSDREEIKNLFKQECFLVDFSKNKYKNLVDQKDRIVVVYANLYNNLNYYKKAINEFINNKPNPLFLLCVDDENILNELKIFINRSEYYILKEDELLSFTLLQQFNNFIIPGISDISNIDFIWWCAWLSNYRYVIAPGPRDINLHEDKWIII
jgi:hypothetical protein